MELVKMGQDVTVYTTDLELNENLQGRNRIKELNDLGIHVVRFHVVDSSILRMATKCFFHPFYMARKMGLATPDEFLFSDALFYSPQIRELYLAIKNRKDFDVINGTMIGNGELYFIERICRKKNVPFVFTPRTHALEPYVKKTFPLWLKIAEDADAIIVFTDYEKDYYIKRGIDASKIFITGIGIQTEEFKTANMLSFKVECNIPNDHRIVLHIGRMDKYKGAELLIKSMKEVWRKMPETSLVILGKSTSYTQEIKRIAGKEKRITLLPDASERTKIGALFCSDLLVHPSQYESFGRVFLEAWVAGKPVIGARTPVNEYVIREGQDGLLLNTLDVDELADKIIFLLQHENIAKNMGRKGREKTLRNHTWEKAAKQTLEVYEWAMK
jgi:glycosyltransferase involved in cell wall biosynthesis